MNIRKLPCLPLFFLFFGPAVALAGDIMFEGYYRLDLSGKRVGYFIQRYAFDAKAKTFESVSFLRANIQGKTLQESVKAVSTDKFAPLSFQYTLQDGSEFKTVDGSFKGQVMTLKKSDGKTSIRNETYKIPPKTILSSFLVYVMMQNPLRIDKPVNYNAVAEEEGNSYSGAAVLERKTDKDKDGNVSLHIRNKFKAETFYSDMTAVPDPEKKDFYVRGEVFSTNSPAKNLTTKLVEKPEEATEGQAVPNKVLLSLFGNMPTGKINLLNSPPKRKDEK